MSEKHNCITLIVDGNYKTALLEKIITRHDSEQNADVVGLKVIIDGVEYMTPHNNYYMEGAVIYLQRIMPKNIDIACCQSCRHGNFRPMGDIDDKIFCLFDYKPRNKTDVELIISKDEDSDSPELLHRCGILHWCDRYEKIDTNNYYTYNEWEYYLKKYCSET